jgi:hypothetical protein
LILIRQGFNIHAYGETEHAEILQEWFETAGLIYIVRNFSCTVRKLIRAGIKFTWIVRSSTWGVRRFTWGVRKSICAGIKFTWIVRSSTRGLRRFTWGVRKSIHAGIKSIWVVRKFIWIVRNSTWGVRSFTWVVRWIFFIQYCFKKKERR